MLKVSTNQLDEDVRLRSSRRVRTFSVRVVETVQNFISSGFAFPGLVSGRAVAVSVLLQLVVGLDLFVDEEFVLKHLHDHCVTVSHLLVVMSSDTVSETRRQAEK